MVMISHFANKRQQTCRQTVAMAYITIHTGEQPASLTSPHLAARSL